MRSSARSTWCTSRQRVGRPLDPNASFTPGGRPALIVAEIQAGGANSLRWIAADLNERGVPTGRGGL